MLLSNFHAVYMARKLSQRGAVSHVDDLAATLQDAAVDPLPHRIDAALYVLRNPIS